MIRVRVRVGVRVRVNWVGVMVTSDIFFALYRLGRCLVVVCVFALSCRCSSCPDG